MRETRNNIQTFFRSINRSVVAVLVLAFSSTACVESDWTPYKSKAEIHSTLLTSQASTVSGSTVGDPSFMWVLQVVQGSDFCTPLKAAGTVGQNFSLKVAANHSGEEREAKIQITFTDGYTNSFTIRQLAETENVEYDHPWAEQPEYQQGSSLIHKTYYTTFSDGRRMRNFSICYDTDKKCSRWVAYPAHNIYTSGRNYEVGGSTAGRTNAWSFDDAITKYKYASNYNEAYEYVSTYDSTIDTYDTHTDPIIPQSKQADIRFRNGIGGGYARGHMLPSADRYNTWNTNAQTCFSTNMMAQDYDFNSGSWATLENKVRSNAICADTLYVVVGTLFETTKTVTNYTKYDKNGNSISQKAHTTVSVPSHCFKLLLRTKSGSTKKHISEIKSANELMCIAFIWENNAAAANVSLSNAATSVAEIERRSGFTFFRNLDPSIAEEVKKQNNFSDWKF